MFLILLAVLLITLIYLKIVRPHSYWTGRFVKQRKQTFLLGDNAPMIFKKQTFWDLMKSIYNAFPEDRYVGVYQFLLPKLVIRDADLIKQVTVKDFDHFVDHKPAFPKVIDPLWNRNLIALQGDRWRDMRSTLSPSFTTSKMKTIFTLVSDCAVEFTRHFVEKKQDVTPVELKDISSRYTNDVIASVAFGVNCDSLTEPNNEFYVMGKELSDVTGFRKSMKFMAFMLLPGLCKILGLKFFSDNVAAFFNRIITDTMRLREEKGIVRPDMLHLLMEARKKHGETITDVDITAQAVLFFLGGFESVSTLMCFMGHELTVNPEIQEKLYAEIRETLKECDGALTYEALVKMKYFDMVVSETLRKWPPTIITDRMCVKPYTIPAISPDEKPLNLVPGDVLLFVINGLHWDPRYFPNPEVFDPERFSDENKADIHPYSYLPFGAGPRNCIGSRFAVLETKAVFFNLLASFEFVAVDKTSTPLKFKKNSFALVPEDGFWIGLKPRKKNKT